MPPFIPLFSQYAKTFRNWYYIFHKKKKENDNSVFLFSSFEYKPSGLLGYSMGPGGGQSACVAARPFLAEMGCLPVKTMTQIGTVRMDIFISL